jgi:hypothetical protein
MARPTKEERFTSTHAEAMRRFDRVQTDARNERIQCLQDRRFYSIAGAMWEGQWGDQFKNRPQIEINKIQAAVIKIIDEYRANRITVTFVNKDGSPDSSLADACNGLYRADEQDSTADEAYDNAFEEAVAGGIGAWRLRAVPDDEDDPENEHQRIVFEPIYDADSCVYFDLDAKRQDKADASYCFVMYQMDRAAFEDEYGKDAATNLPKLVHQSEYDWATPDYVRIAEYYLLEKRKETLNIFQDQAGNQHTYTQDELDADEDLLAELEAMGLVFVRQRKITRKRVHKYLLNGAEVLEDYGYIAGTCIPIIPVFGKRWYIDGVERCAGHVRLAKDAQRVFNTQISKIVEISAMNGYEKPIFLSEQIINHSDMWVRDNIENYPYLVVDPILNTDGTKAPAGPIAFTKAPELPPAVAALLQFTDGAIEQILGAPQQAEKMVSNTSGKAIELIQQRVDARAAIYISNFAKAIKRCGEVWLSMARELYVEEGRRLKSVDSMGDVSSVELKRPMLTEKGEVEVKNDLGAANFDVWVDVGPSSSSKRQAVVRELSSLIPMATSPQTQQVLLSYALMNIEGEGLADMREWNRKQLVGMGVVPPNEEERKQIEAAAAQPQQPSPQDAWFLAEAEKNTAEAARARMDTLESMADIKLKEAQTAETYAKAGAADSKATIEAIKTLAPVIDASAKGSVTP